jgi:hypothetical protein
VYNSIKHAAGLKRASELKTRIQEYLDIEKTIETGFTPLFGSPASCTGVMQVFG